MNNTTRDNLNNNVNKEKNKMARRLAINMLITIILALCLCVTSVALVLSTVTVSGNVFSTAIFDIELYNEDDVLEGPIITKDDGFLFEPGMTVKKKFRLYNNGTVNAYFRIYFDSVSGGLADVLQIRITDANDNEIYGWKKITDMLKEDAVAADEILEAKENLELYIWFHMPKETGSEAKSLTLTFDLCADAVQVRNNKNKVFENETKSESSASESNTLGESETESST